VARERARPRALLAHPRSPACERVARVDDHAPRQRLLCPGRCRGCESIIDGQRLCDLHVGANLHPNFALEHHGFFHPGYVNRTLLSLFSAAYAFEDAGREAPQLLLRHVPEVWDVQRRLLLWDGRLAYPAGDDYPRYCWGQLYLLPVLVFIQHQYEDPTAAWAERAARRVCSSASSR
jgi:hypothetical protein